MNTTNKVISITKVNGILICYSRKHKELLQTNEIQLQKVGQSSGNVVMRNKTG